MAIDPEAVYNQNEADLKLQEGNEEAALNEREGNLKANTDYQEGQLTRAEPGTYTAESNTANKEGLLTSGANSHRKEGIASTFAARRTANQLALTQGEANVKREREAGQLKRTERRHGNQETLATERDRQAKENPQAATPTMQVAPPEEGGVPQSPYGGPMTPAPGGGWQYKGPGGTWVRVGGKGR